MSSVSFCVALALSVLGLSDARGLHSQALRLPYAGRSLQQNELPTVTRLRVVNFATLAPANDEIVTENELSGKINVTASVEPVMYGAYYLGPSEVDQMDRIISHELEAVPASEAVLAPVVGFPGRSLKGRSVLDSLNDMQPRRIPTIFAPFYSGFKFELVGRESPPGTTLHFSNMTLMAANATYESLATSGILDYFNLPTSARVCITNSMFVLESCEGFVPNSFHMWCCTKRQCNIEYTEQAIEDLGYPLPDALELLTCHDLLPAGGQEEAKSPGGSGGSDLVVPLVASCLTVAAVIAVTQIAVWQHRRTQHANRTKADEMQMQIGKHMQQLEKHREKNLSEQAQLCSHSLFMRAAEATHNRVSIAHSTDPYHVSTGSTQMDSQSAHDSLKDHVAASNIARARNAFQLPTVTHSTTFDVTTKISLSKPTSAGSTLDRETLELALDRLAITREPFLGQFEMLGPVQRREGGQGTVQFALAKRSGAAVAIKFFLNRNAFDVEEGLYMRDGLRSMMPAITMIENNDSGVAVTEEGWRYPPFIVVERGESLDEWQARIQPDFPTIVQVLSHVTERVKTMHGLGLVHRDLKPGNVLWRPGQHSWTLIDFGCAANTGETARLTYSLAYSAPEALSELNDGADTIIASTSLDMWAIGVIAYELMTGGSAFPMFEWVKGDVHEAALGKRAYPWEHSIGTFRNLPQLRALRDPVRACLSRDPSKRPTSEQFLSQLNAMFDLHHGMHQTNTSTITHSSINDS